MLQLREDDQLLLSASHKADRGRIGRPDARGELRNDAAVQHHRLTHTADPGKYVPACGAQGSCLRADGYGDIARGACCTAVTIRDLRHRWTGATRGSQPPSQSALSCATSAQSQPRGGPLQQRQLPQETAAGQDGARAEALVQGWGMWGGRRSPHRRAPCGRRRPARRRRPWAPCPGSGPAPRGHPPAAPAAAATSSAKRHRLLVDRAHSTRVQPR